MPIAPVKTPAPAPTFDTASFNPDTLTGNLKEKVLAVKKANVREINFQKPSFRGHGDSVWVDLPFTVDLLDTDGILIENLKGTVAGLASASTNEVFTFSVINESLLTHQLAFNLQEADF